MSGVTILEHLQARNSKRNRGQGGLEAAGIPSGHEVEAIQIPSEPLLQEQMIPTWPAPVSTHRTRTLFGQVSVAAM